MKASKEAEHKLIGVELSLGLRELGGHCLGRGQCNIFS